MTVMCWGGRSQARWPAGLAYLGELQANKIHCLLYVQLPVPCAFPTLHTNTRTHTHTHTRTFLAVSISLHSPQAVEAVARALPEKGRGTWVCLPFHWVSFPWASVAEL